MAGPDDGRARFRAEGLRDFTTAVLAHYGFSEPDARLGAEILIDADLCGIESHGIAHLAGHRGYVPGLESGVVKAQPAVRVLRGSQPFLGRILGGMGEDDLGTLARLTEQAEELGLLPRPVACCAAAG